MSRRSHGATYSGARSATFSEGAWLRMKEAQARFAVEAYRLGEQDLQAGHPPRINMAASYYAGYHQRGEIA